MLLTLLPAAGCGTAANLADGHTESGGRRPFGGVERDWASIRPGESPGPTDAARQDAGAGLLYAIDLPLSLIGDLLTWPYTVAYTWANRPAPVPAFPSVGPPTVVRVPATLSGAVTPPVVTPVPVVGSPRSLSP